MGNASMLVVIFKHFAYQKRSHMVSAISGINVHGVQLSKLAIGAEYGCGKSCGFTVRKARDPYFLVGTFLGLILVLPHNIDAVFPVTGAFSAPKGIDYKSGYVCSCYCALP